MENKKNILITGIDGFIGSALKKHFLKTEYEVWGTVFDRKPEDNEFHVDFTRSENLNVIPDMYFDAVIHTVGTVDQSVDGKLMKKVNIGGAENICSWLKNGKGTSHLIHMSSVTIYGISMLGQNITEKTPRYNGPLAIPYMRTKARAEVVIENSNIPYSMLRLPVVLGKGDSYVSPVITDSMKKNNFYIYGKGDKLISLMYVKNLGSLIQAVIDNGPLMKGLNAADYHIPWKEYAEYYSKLLKKEIPGKSKGILSLLGALFDKKRQLIMTYSFFGTHTPDNALRNITGWKPPYFWKQGVEEALEDFI